MGGFNGSGVYNRFFNWVTDHTNLVPVTDSRMDQEMDGVATGLSTCLTKDGQQNWAANQNSNGFKLINLAAGTGSADSIRLDQLTNFQKDTNGSILTTGTSTA